MTLSINLQEDVIFDGFKALFNSYGIPGPDHPSLVVREVCKEWERIANTALRVILKGLTDLPRGLLLPKSLFLPTSTQDVDKNHTLQALRGLNRKVRKFWEQAIELPKGTCLINQTQFNAVKERLQLVQDRVLTTCWKREIRERIQREINELPPKIAAQLPNPEAPAPVIRKFLKQPGVTGDVTELSLTWLELEALPFEIELFTELRTLDLSHNRLRRVEIDLNCLQQNLRLLHLSFNPIKKLPADLNLPKLSLLKIRETAIDLEKLPAAIKTLPHDKILR
jgi:Leucine-rich repeat (LRR) protein